MLKSLSVALIATGLVMGLADSSQPGWAGTCAAPCPGPAPIQFIPGQRINLEIVNSTASLVQVQKIYGTDPVPLRPGQTLYFDQVTGTTPNLSMVFWDETALFLRADIKRPTPSTLRVELRPGGRPPGDRSLYILNDGRVAVF